MQPSEDKGTLDRKVTTCKPYDLAGSGKEGLLRRSALKGHDEYRGGLWEKGLKTCLKKSGISFEHMPSGIDTMTFCNFISLSLRIMETICDPQESPGC